MIRRIRECCNSLLEGKCKEHVQEASTDLQLLMPHSLPPTASSQYKFQSHLPPKEIARKYVAIAFDQILPLFKFIHVPSFNTRFETFYASQHLPPTLDDIRFEALLNELLALGELLCASNHSSDAMRAEAGVRA
jgi:hypothetical protein